MSGTLHAATVNIQQRIAEIDALLSETEALRAEREHLARALEEVVAATGAPAATGATRGARAGGDSDSGTRRSTPKGAARSGRGSSRTRKRAPQGLNRERIVGFLRDNGPASASAIARGTQINRAVVYNNLSKMTSDGTVRGDDGADGTKQFHLA